MESLHEQAVDALAREIVAEVSPAELPLFRATASRFRADPSGTLGAKPATGEPLGFGAEAVMVLVTPYALDLVKRLMSRVAERLGDGAADTLAERILRRFAGGGKAEKSVVPESRQPAPLTAQQLVLIAETTRAEAGELALPPDQAERLADAVVAAIATRL